MISPNVTTLDISHLFLVCRGAPPPRPVPRGLRPLGDGCCVHLLQCGDLAAATLATILRALSTMTLNCFAAIAFVSTIADPTPTATAPARSQSPTLSIDTPPVGISFICGSGPLMSLKYPGPTDVAGNTLMTSAPMSHAERISVGVKHPGITGTPSSCAAWMTSGRNTGLTMNWAPA